MPPVLKLNYRRIRMGLEFGCNTKSLQYYYKSGNYLSLFKIYPMPITVCINLFLKPFSILLRK